MATHTLHVDADATVIPLPSPYQHIVASIGVVVAPFSGWLAYLGLTQGQGVALLAMETNGWLVPVLTAVAFVLNKVYDRLAIFQKQERLIIAQVDEIRQLKRDVINLSAAVESLMGQVAEDKDTQIRLRSDLSDAYARLSQYEPRTPNPDA